METTLPLPLIPFVDLGKAPGSEGGLTREQLSYLGCVYFVATDDNLDRLLQFLQRHVSIETYVDVTNLSAIGDVTAVLDAGARKVFRTEAQTEELKEFEERVAPIVQNHEQLKSLNTVSGGILISSDINVTDIRKILGAAKERKMSNILILIKNTEPLQAQLDIATSYGAVPIIPASLLNMDLDAKDQTISVPTLIASSWTSDRPDKLLPTVVTDERGVSLGLVYSSRESLSESFKTGTGVYQSRKRGLWYKGATSGDTQGLIRVAMDCDRDCLKFMVKQKGRFCHLPQPTCFGDYRGLTKLEKTLMSRKDSAPVGSYTARLFSDEKLLRAKIMEEAEELCNAKSKQEIAFEAADLIYFSLVKAVSSGVSLQDIESNLDAKSVKVKRRKGDAKGQWAEKEGLSNGSSKSQETKTVVEEAASVPKSQDDPAGLKNNRISMRRLVVENTSNAMLAEALQRPSQKSTETIMGIIKPIINDVQKRGDSAVLEYTHKFEKATSLTTPVIKAPFPQSLMELPSETIAAIDISFENIRKFHAAQKEDNPLRVETMPGIVCSRFARAIERVGLYVPGGTAVLPSSALMLGVPAMVAGCKKIVIASPPRSDGSITPEIVYVAHKVGAESIVLAGGAQAIAAMAYGTESVSKVDKILGPGNQFVTAAKMFVSNDTNAGVSIDMPAGPSEVLVIADKDANPAFVASDLLSQAEHGTDSQVVLIAIGLSDKELKAIEDELHAQASALPRVDIVRGAIEHSVTLVVESVEEALRLSNQYAPEHLILQINNAAAAVDMVENAGSVFIGEWTPESVGDYSAGVNHSLPTYGYAKQYSGVNLASYVKHITSSNLTAEGLRNVGGAVMQLAKVEELEAHRRAVSIRIDYMDRNKI